jgi:hypothetical protein
MREAGMSHAFLAALVDRAEGRTPVLERRPRALFEPQRDAAPRIEELASEHPIEAPRVHAPAAHRPDRPERPNTSPALTAAATPARAPLSRTPEAVPRAQPAPTLPRLAAVPPAPAHRAAATAIDGEAGRTARPAPAHETAATHRERGAPTPRRVDVPALRVQQVATPSKAPELAARTAVWRDVMPARPAALLAMAARQASPRREPAAAPALPPPVQVTIGRVEVRAAQSPAQPVRKASTAAPSLSLDEYLRRRTGGTR